MAQYNKANSSFVAQSTSIFDVVMLANSAGGVSLGGSVARAANTPTVTASTYAANKCMGGVMTLTNILPNTAPFAATLESIALKFKGSVQTQTMYVALFDSAPTGTFTDTTTAAIAGTDTGPLLGIYALSTPVSVLGTHTIYNLDGILRGINGQGANLYAVVVPGGTTAALANTTDMILSVAVIQG